MKVLIPIRKRFSVRNKLLFIFVLFLAVGCTLLGVSYYNSRIISDAADKLKLYSDRMHAVSDLQVMIHRLIMPANDYIISGEEIDKGEYSKYLEKTRHAFREMDRLLIITPEVRVLSMKAAEEIERLDSLAQRIFALPSPTTNPDGLPLEKELDAVAYEIDATILEPIHEKAMENAKKAETSARKAREWASLLLIGGVMLSGTGIFLVLWIVRGIVASHKQLGMGVERVTGGDLSYRITIRSGDELEVLGNSFNNMSQKLAEVYSNLERIVEERTSRLEALYVIGQVLARSLDRQEVLEGALAKTMEIMGVEKGDISLLGEDGETLNLKVHKGWSPPFLQHIQTSRLGEDLCGRAAQQKKTIAVDMGSCSAEDIPPYLREEGLRHVASAPLVSKGRLIGTIGLGTCKQRAFSEGDLDLLTTIAHQIAMAGENARLHQDSLDKIEELERFQRATVQREFHMKELRDELDRIKGKK